MPNSAANSALDRSREAGYKWMVRIFTRQVKSHQHQHFLAVFVKCEAIDEWKSAARFDPTSTSLTQ